MPLKSHPGGEGATGLAVACFFHPGKPIREKWQDYKKKRLAGIIILGQGECRIGHKLVANTYPCRIPEIEEIDFFIHPSNFQVDMPCPDPSKVFNSDHHAADGPAPTQAAMAVINPNRELQTSTTM